MSDPLAEFPDDAPPPRRQETREEFQERYKRRAEQWAAEPKARCASCDNEIAAKYLGEDGRCRQCVATKKPVQEKQMEMEL